MMTDHLQSAKDENITLVQQINHLQKEIEMKGLLCFFLENFDSKFVKG